MQSASQGAFVASRLISSDEIKSDNRWIHLDDSSKDGSPCLPVTRYFAAVQRRSKIRACVSQANVLGLSMVIMCAEVFNSLGLDRAWDIKAAAMRLPPNIAVAEMEVHNAVKSQTYVQVVNRSTDLTLEEFQALPIRGYSAGAKPGSPKVDFQEYKGGRLADTVKTGYTRRGQSS